MTPLCAPTNAKPSTLSCAPSNYPSTAAGVATDGTVVEKCFLGSVKVLGEGVDTPNCDSVYWADVRGSMPDLVQAVGRALRIHPGEGKMASLVVPVRLGPGETADNMLTSRAYGGLAKLLQALRAHDTRVVEVLAQQQTQSRVTGVQSRSGGEGEGAESDRSDRLNRGGDRQLNRAMHTITLIRMRLDPATKAYVARRTGEGKSPRDAQRCLKRNICRQIFKILKRGNQPTPEVLAHAA